MKKGLKIAELAAVWKPTCSIALSHNFSQLEAWNDAIKYLHVWYLKGEEWYRPSGLFTPWDFLANIKQTYCAFKLEILLKIVWNLRILAVICEILLLKTHWCSQRRSLNQYDYWICIKQQMRCNDYSEKPQLCYSKTLDLIWLSFKREEEKI